MKADDDKVRDFGIEFGIKQSQELIDGGCRFLHFYTMNLEASVIKIIKGLGILNKHRELPFIQGSSSKRKEEDVRPIFWQNKPSSYLQKTQNWDEFPNGRWGKSSSPAFGGEMDGFVSYSKRFKTSNHDSKKKEWGERCTCFSDVSNVFVRFIQGKMKKFPFSEGAIALETEDISDILVKMNSSKLFTINS